jgi:hypothetical protein
LKSRPPVRLASARFAVELKDMDEDRDGEFGASVTVMRSGVMNGFGLEPTNIRRMAIQHGTDVRTHDILLLLIGTIQLYELS